MRNAALLLVMAASSMGSACGADDLMRACTAIAVPALNVVVLDGSTGDKICDATVLAVDGSFSSVLDPFPAGPTCSYSGPHERPGVYEVSVTKAGYQPATERNVRVTADECHVVTRQLTLTLAR